MGSPHPSGTTDGTRRRAARARHSGPMTPQPDTHRTEDDMADPVTAHDTISTAQLAAIS